MLIVELIFQFEENGFAVIENFLSPEEIATVYQAGRDLSLDAPSEKRKTFSASTDEATGAQHKETYFL